MRTEHDHISTEHSPGSGPHRHSRRRPPFPPAFAAGGPGFGGPGFDGGFGPGFGPGFGRRGPGFGPRSHGRHGRARRGDVRAAILSLLAEAPSNGYGLIKAIAERTDDTWRPSPGSVYPTLAQLVDEGLVAPVDPAAARSDYQLTEPGRAYVEEHRDELAAAWSGATQVAHEHGELITATRKLVGAIRQFGPGVTDDQNQRAIAKIDELRRELYRLLGE